MIKTDVYIVCDKCEKKLKNSDRVYGYAKFQDRNIVALGMKDYTEYFFDPDCYSDIKKEIAESLKNQIISKIKENKLTNLYFYIPYISESFSINYMDYAETDAWYFSVSINNKNQLMKVRKNCTDFDFIAICFDDVVSLMLSGIKEGRLDELRGQFEKEARDRALAAQTAYDACSAYSSVKGTITTTNSHNYCE